MAAIHTDLTSDHQQPGVLRRLSPTLQDGDEFDINIVIVPEVGSPMGKRLAETPWVWLDRISSMSTITPQLLIFEYSLAKSGIPIWQSLVQRGGELVNSLLTQEQTFRILERPLVFVVHGLGGMILKRALSTYGQNYNQTFQRLLDVHFGILFLGTPHTTYVHQENWKVLNLILRSAMKLSKLSLSQAEVEAAIVANVSLKFEEAGIDVPMLSAYETSTTKIHDSIFWHRKIMLVTRDIADMALKSEKMFPVDKNHRDICVVEENHLLFREFIAMLETSVAQGIPESQSLTSPPEQLPLDDLMWHSTAPDADNQYQLVNQDSESKQRSKEAIFGSTEASSFEIIPTISELTQNRPTPRLPCYLLGPELPIRNFVGRKDVLTKIESILSRDHIEGLESSFRSTVPRSFALCGVGGIGKTQVITEYVHLYQTKYDAIFWVQADNDNSIAESFATIAKELKLLNSSERNDSVVSRNLVMEWLSHPVKQSPPNVEAEESISSLATWLLIFDNADDLDVLRDYWPSAGNGGILVTSQDPLAKGLLTVTDGIDLEPLAAEEGSDLMMKVAGYRPTSENKRQSLELAKRLGGLPLAISQISAMISRRDMTFKEFLDLYGEDESSRELILGQDQYQHTLSTYWRLNDLSSPAKCLLDVLSLLDPDSISETSLMNHLPEKPSNDFPSTKLLYIEARKSLIKSSLVRRNKDKGQLLLHRIIQDVTRARMSMPELKTAFQLTTNMLSRNWPEASYNFSHETSLWDASDNAVPHVLKVSAIYSKNPDWEIPINVLSDLAELLQKGGWHVAEKGNFRAAEDMFASSLRICEAHAEDMPELYADALFCSGSYASDTNQFQLHMKFARKHFYQRMSVEMQNPELGLGAGMAHSEMGLAYLLNDMYEESIKSCITSRQINEKTAIFLSGSYWPFFAIIHHAQALIGLNRGDEAVNMLLDTLRWREAKYGPNDTESYKLGYTLQILGMIHEKQGNRVQSLEYFNRALTNYKATIGMNHHRTGHVLVKLAEEHALLGQVDTANILFDQALKTFASHSSYKPETARTTFKKALFHQSFANKKEAEDLFRQSRVLYSQIHPNPPSFETPLTIGDFDSKVALWAR